MERLANRHYRLGWSALALFVLVGLLLEGLHGWKAGFYLDADAAVRREMWTLAHAHGAGIALVQLVFAAWLERRASFRLAALASELLRLALVLVPLGFFLGGLVPGRTDPGAGVWLVPIGAACLFVATAMIAREALAARSP